MDGIFILLAGGFFALTLWLIRFSEKLREEGKP
jgi:hypothetical protein